MTWVENVGVDFDRVFWRPTGLPLVWPAVSNTGSAFNIPDEWNGNLGTNWGFPPVVLSGISFSEGSCTISYMKPGWNIYEIWGSITTNTGVNRVDPWPRTASATDMPIADQLEIKAVVPIPGALWLLGSGLAGIVLWRRKARG
jgi:hypothetical protein